MQKDLLNTFATAVAVTTQGDQALGDVIDQTVKSSAAARPPTFIVRVDTTVTSAGAATVAAVLQDSADNSSWADVVSGAVIAKATLVAGKEMVKVKVPVGTRRYLRAIARIATADLTAGKFDAYLVDGADVMLKDVA
jgi:hypothetical protein